MKYDERELLEGMRNCHRACGEDFEATVRMVSSTRRRKEIEVKSTLLQIANKYENHTEYIDLRKQIPKEFPF